MSVRIDARVPEHSLPIAATFLGIRGSSRAGIIRTALALFQGKTPAEAISYADGGRDVNTHGLVGAMVPDELVPTDVNKSWAVRVGLGMAAGLSREQAESWARMDRGRPRKEVTS
jgi:hypothetical protein